MVRSRAAAPTVLRQPCRQYRVRDTVSEATYSTTTHSAKLTGRRAQPVQTATALIRVPLSEARRDILTVSTFLTMTRPARKTAQAVAHAQLAKKWIPLRFQTARFLTTLSKELARSAVKKPIRAVWYLPITQVTAKLRASARQQVI